MTTIESGQQLQTKRQHHLALNAPVKRNIPGAQEHFYNLTTSRIMPRLFGGMQRLLPLIVNMLSFARQLKRKPGSGRTPGQGRRRLSNRRGPIDQRDPEQQRQPD